MALWLNFSLLSFTLKVLYTHVQVYLYAHTRLYIGLDETSVKATTRGHTRGVTVLFHFHWKVITIKQLTYADNLSLILLHTKFPTAEKTKLLQKPSSFDSSGISYKRMAYEPRTWVFSYAIAIFLFLPCWPHFWTTSCNWDRVLWEITGSWFCPKVRPWILLPGLVGSRTH